MTYTSFTEMSFEPAPGVTKAVHFTNFELGCIERSVMFKSDAIVNAILNTPSTEISALYTGGAPGNGDVAITINALNLGVPRSTLQAALSIASDPTLSTAYLKLRIVAGGNRIFKTSSNDNESGTMDILYSRDGSTFDEGDVLARDLARPRADRMRTYIARASTCDHQGVSGFLAQVNKRPHDEASFNY